MLEPDGITATSSEVMYWRRRVHPGWNQLVWDDFSQFPAERAVGLRLLEGDGSVSITSVHRFARVSDSTTSGRCAASSPRCSWLA